MLSSSSGRCRVESSGAGKVMLVNDGVLLTPDKEKTSAMRSRVRRLRKHSTQVMRAAGGDSTSEVLPGGVTNATTTTSATDQTKGPTDIATPLSQLVGTLPKWRSSSSRALPH